MKRKKNYIDTNKYAGIADTMFSNGGGGCKVTCVSLYFSTLCIHFSMFGLFGFETGLPSARLFPQK